MVGLPSLRDTMHDRGPSADGKVHRPIVPRIPIKLIGVSTTISPLGAIWPVTKEKVPWTTDKTSELSAPPGS